MTTLTVRNIIIAIDTIPAGGRNDRQSRERATISAMLHALLPGEVSVSHRPDGSPFLEGRPDLTISISHSATRAVIALHPGNDPIGIDTETLRPQLERILDRYLSPAEQAEWPTRADHLIAWCIKEAAYKAAGIPGTDLTRDITIDRSERRVTVSGTTLDYTIAEQTDTDAIVLATLPVSTHEI